MISNELIEKCIMISKQELKEQLENIIGEDITGEKVIDILNSLSSEISIFWGCIPKNILNETF